MVRQLGEERTVTLPSCRSRASTPKGWAREMVVNLLQKAWHEMFLGGAVPRAVNSLWDGPSWISSGQGCMVLLLYLLTILSSLALAGRLHVWGCTCAVALDWLSSCG